jgi:membrane protease subunit (stomatin/prohibitin family)
MGLFGKKNEGGMMDVIRCDQEEYLIWKWRPSGAANSTSKENGIRWGSSLRVKDGEVAVFVYKQADGQMQDFIEGPFDETIKTANFPVLSRIVGLAYAGQAPFQAEVYFINLAGNIRMPVGVPYFDVFDPRFMDFPVKVAVRGSLVFNLTDYRRFIKLHRLVNFDLDRFRSLVRDAVVKYIKGIVSNAPTEHGIPVLQVERKLLEINDLVLPRVRAAFETDFGVNLLRLDIDVIEVDKDTEEYRQLRSITADLEVAMRQKQNHVALRNLDDTQLINAENMAETLRIQREETQRFQRLQSETQFIAAHQLDQQTSVLRTAADNLGQMSTMNLGSGSNGGGGGFNPVGMMTGLAGKPDRRHDEHGRHDDGRTVDDAATVRAGPTGTTAPSAPSATGPVQPQHRRTDARSVPAGAVGRTGPLRPADPHDLCLEARHGRLGSRRRRGRTGAGVRPRGATASGITAAVTTRGAAMRNRHE